MKMEHKWVLIINENKKNKKMQKKGKINTKLHDMWA